MAHLGPKRRSCVVSALIHRLLCPRHLHLPFPACLHCSRCHRGCCRFHGVVSGLYLNSARFQTPLGPNSRTPIVGLPLPTRIFCSMPCSLDFAFFSIFHTVNWFTQNQYEQHGIFAYCGFKLSTPEVSAWGQRAISSKKKPDLRRELSLYEKSVNGILVWKWVWVSKGVSGLECRTPGR